jgi:hypothetical protein
MSEHYWGSNKGFEILANSVQNLLPITPKNKPKGSSDANSRRLTATLE